MNSTKKQRAAHDEAGARASIEMAVRQEKKVGLAVDDMPKVAKMLARVTRRADSLGLSYKVETTDLGAHVRFAGSERAEVYVFAADKLLPVSERPN